MKNTLIISTHNITTEALSNTLNNLGFNVSIFSNFNNLKNIVEIDRYKFIFINLDLDPKNGLNALKLIKNNNKDSVVIMYTSDSSIDMAVNSIKDGADEYFTIPFDFTELKKTLNKYIYNTKKNKSNKNTSLDEANNNYKGTNKHIIHLNNIINRVANVPSSILITGESGTGKGYYAKKIHNLSNRKNKPFIHVDCASIPINLLESELFGHVKGSFTGAIKDKKGKFELAKDGTIFLDEIGTLPLNLQVKLLNVLQEKFFYPIGSESKVQLNARIISATNENLLDLIEEQTFREDLYYRINVVHLQIPPLRNRKDDIEDLVYTFLHKFSNLFEIEVPKLSKEYISSLYEYSWPGNIRELENTIESSLALSDSNCLKFNDLPIRIKNNFANYKDNELIRTKSLDIDSDINSPLFSEKNAIISALKINSGHRANTAKFLGISRRTLQYKLKKYDLLDINFKNYHNFNR